MLVFALNYQVKIPDRGSFLKAEIALAAGFDMTTDKDMDFLRKYLDREVPLSELREKMSEVGGEGGYSSFND